MVPSSHRFETVIVYNQLSVQYVHDCMCGSIISQADCVHMDVVVHICMCVCIVCVA